MEIYIPFSIYPSQKIEKKNKFHKIKGEEIYKNNLKYSKTKRLIMVFLNEVPLRKKTAFEIGIIYISKFLKITNYYLS